MGSVWDTQWISHQVVLYYIYQKNSKVHNFYQNIEISVNDDQKGSINESQKIINDQNW